MPAPSRPRPIRMPLALLLAACAVLLGGCALDTPHNDRAEAQATAVLRSAGLPEAGVLVYVERGDSEPAVTVQVTYAKEATASVAAPLVDTTARTLWQRAIVQIDSVAVDTLGEVPPRGTVTLDAAELGRRFGPRPAGLVQVDGGALYDEEQRLMGGFFGLLFAASLVPLLIVGLVVLGVVAGLVILVVVLRRQRPPPPAFGPPGYPPA